MTLQTHFDFTLPRGYIDNSGLIHKQGTMKLATALDEISATQSPQAQINSAYLPLALLSKVVTQLGSLTDITAEIIGGLFASDLLYLEELYQRINSLEPTRIKTICPTCQTSFYAQVKMMSSEEG